MTNKPNIEVPNHTDKELDSELYIFFDNATNEWEAIHDIGRSVDKAKTKLRNYISEEIKAVIGSREPVYYGAGQVGNTPEEDRNELRGEQLLKARNRGHNV